MEADLYAQLRKLYRPRLVRAIGAQDADDLLHDIWIAVAERITAGEVREPLAYAGGVVRYAIARQITRLYRARRHASLDASDVDSGRLNGTRYAAEVALAERRPEDPDPEQAAAVRAALEILPTKKKDVLTRIYFEEQPRPEVLTELRISSRQLTQAEYKALSHLKALLARPQTRKDELPKAA